MKVRTCVFECLYLSTEHDMAQRRPKTTVKAVVRQLDKSLRKIKSQSIHHEVYYKKSLIKKIKVTSHAIRTGFNTNKHKTAPMK